MRIILTLIALLWGLAGGAHADLRRPPPTDCQALQAQMFEGLQRDGQSREERVASLRGFIETIPAECTVLKEEADRILFGMTHAQAAPTRPSTQQFTLPNFPWPPPTPSARLVVPRNRIVAALPERPNLYQVGAHLADALQRARYSEYSFFAVPNGFALTARLERIRDDGTPAPEEFRFLEPGAAEPFSLSTYVTRLFFAPEGFYRQIAFVVTDKPFVASREAPTSQEAEEWLRQGANMLPEIYRTMPFGSGYRVTALVYEFRKGAQDRDVATLTPGRIAGRTHLEKSGIYPALIAP